MFLNIAIIYFHLDFGFHDLMFQIGEFDYLLREDPSSI